MDLVEVDKIAAWEARNIDSIAIGNIGLQYEFGSLSHDTDELSVSVAEQFCSAMARTTG